MQVEPAGRRDRLLDGEAGELVPERHARRLGVSMPEARHSSSRRRLAGERLEQPELGVRRDDRDRLEQRLRGGAEARGAGEHRFPDRVRDRSRSRGERLDDEERVAGGLAVELVGVDAVRLGELRDRRRRERGEPQPRDCAGSSRARRARSAAGARASSSSSRYLAMTSAGTVSTLRASSRKTSSVASSAQCRSSSTKTVGARARSSRASAATTSCGGTARARAPRARRRALGDGEERAERTRREERIAGAPEHPRRCAALLAEAPHEGGLADARLAADQHDAAPRAAPDGLQALVERRQLALRSSSSEIGTGTFGDRTHGGIVRCSMSEIKPVLPGEKICGCSVSSRSRAHLTAPSAVRPCRALSPNACTRGFVLAKRPLGFGYQSQTCIVIRSGARS